MHVAKNLTFTGEQPVNSTIRPEVLLELFGKSLTNLFVVGALKAAFHIGKESKQTHISHKG